MLISKPLSREELSLQAFPPWKERRKEKILPYSTGKRAFHTVQAVLLCAGKLHCALAAWGPAYLHGDS